MFQLSERSWKNLEGVHPDLVAVTKSALACAEVDFGVICGLRTREQQAELVKAGASQTMKSKHLIGDAVDLMAYVGGKATWELPPYFLVAEAVRTAAIDLGVAIRWGGAWTVPDIRYWEGTMENAYIAYCNQRFSEGRRPFIDAPHFERPNK